MLFPAHRRLSDCPVHSHCVRWDPLTGWLPAASAPIRMQGRDEALTGIVEAACLATSSRESLVRRGPPLASYEEGERRPSPCRPPTHGRPSPGGKRPHLPCKRQSLRESSVRCLLDEACRLQIADVGIGPTVTGFISKPICLGRVQQIIDGPRWVPCSDIGVIALKGPVVRQPGFVP